MRLGIVDDHPVYRSVLSKALKNYDIVVEANNGVDLLQKLAGNTELPEIMLIDVRMPIMDGPSTAARVRNDYPMISLVAISQEDNGKMILRMIKAGCCAYFLKDIDPENLEIAIEEIYNDKFYYGKENLVDHKKMLQAQRGIPIPTQQEQVFLKYAFSDMPYKQIASKMNLSERTIEGYCESLFEKFEVHSRTGLVKAATEWGFI